MKLTNVGVGRAIWLFDVMDLNPRGRHIYEQLFPWLVARYRFAKSPAHMQDQTENGWLFLDGHFEGAEGEAVNVTLKIFNDGLVAETRSSTDDSEVFLGDLLRSATRELGIGFAESMVHKKMYLSELNVTSEKNLDAINPKMQAFSRAISQAFGVSCELTTLGFGGEPAAQPLFKFERKGNLPFSQNKYWSIAGVSTRTHLWLLEQLEELLTA